MESNPLTEFYKISGKSMPVDTIVKASEIPAPYRRLLVHDKDMTSTLQRCHGQTIHIKVLDQQLAEGIYSRKVVLALDQTMEAVEFGAIKIMLHLFPKSARRIILDGIKPLGFILENQQIPYTSKPKYYFQLQSDEDIEEALNLDASHTLYGRRNAIYNEHDEVLAEIIEILP